MEIIKHGGRIFGQHPTFSPEHQPLTKNFTWIATEKKNMNWLILPWLKLVKYIGLKNCTNKSSQ